MRDLTSGPVGVFGRLLAAPHRLRRVRWRLGERIGRALVGGRLAAIEAGLADTGAALEAVRTRLAAGDARLTALAVAGRYLALMVWPGTL